MGPPKCWAPGKCPVCPPLEPALHIYTRYVNTINQYASLGTILYNCSLLLVCRPKLIYILGNEASV